MAAVQARVGWLFAGFLALLTLAAGRAFYLGVLHSSALRAAARTQQVTTETVPAQRGTITDRNGMILATSEPADDVSATPYLVKEPLAAATRLAPLLHLSRATVLTDLSQRSGFVYLAHALPAARARAILALGIAGISATPTTRRVYPRGDLAGQVLGTVNFEGQPLGGIEASENSLLGGEAGQRRVVSDAIGQPVSIADIHSERAGAHLGLTLDANIQQRAEAVLGAVGRVFHPANATAIVMNPNSGALLAVANWPTLNPNAHAVPSLAALEDRAVSFNYEPGSTFKVVAVSGALEAGLITPNTPFAIPDQIQVANRVIHDAEEHPEETLTTAEILARSSNVGAIKIGALEGPERFNAWVHKYGFGAPTGVDLPREESGEALPLRQYSGSSMGNLPIGQGELVTPIQMAAAYSAIANGGILHTPHIVQSVEGRPVHTPAGHRVISTTTAAELREMLRGVLAPGGTASEVSIPGYQLAGKTGTASKVNPQTHEYSETAYVASFIGFAPANNPKLLCAVIVNEPQTGSIYGGTVAAPAFGQIMGFALPYLGIAPE